MAFYHRALGWIGSTLGSALLPEFKQLRAPRIDPRLIIAPLPLSLQVQRIGGALTPLQVSNIIKLADVGYVYQLMDLANEVRQKDNHLQGILQTREIAIQELQWQVRPAKDGQLLKDRKRAEFVTDVLKSLRALPDLIADLAAGDYYGFAVSEIIWEKVDGYIIPTDIRRVPQRRFIFSKDDGRLQWFDASGSMGQSSVPVDLAKEYPGKFIQYQPRIVGDVQCREGLVRPLMWAALFRNWTARDWLQLAELAWKPWRTAKYPKNATDKEISALQSMLDQMSSSTVGTYREGTELEFHWPENNTGTPSSHKELFDSMGNEMSKAVLGQTETTQPTAGAGLASSKEMYNAIRKDIRDARAVAIGGTIQRDLVDVICLLNYGVGVDHSEFAFLTDEAVDGVQFSTMIKNLRSPGVTIDIPAKWVRDQLAIPEPDDDDELVGEGEEEIDPNDPNAAKPGGAPAGGNQDPNVEEQKPKGIALLRGPQLVRGPGGSRVITVPYE